MGSKSARKCTELLLTMIFRVVGSMPQCRYIAWSASCALRLPTRIWMSRMRSDAIGPKFMRAPPYIGPVPNT